MYIYADISLAAAARAAALCAHVFKKKKYSTARSMSLCLLSISVDF
jgi:hypothetical protein